MKKSAKLAIPPDAEDYEVGYGRPPKHRQFAPGTSGNPKGRPRGRKNVAAIIAEIAMQPMTITEGGRPRTVPRVVALILTQWTQAFQGNAKACSTILQGLREAGLLRGEPEADDQPLSEDDNAVISDLIKAQLQGSKRGAQKSTMNNPGSKVTPKKKV